MEGIRRAGGFFWAFALGVIALFLFFAALEAFSPAETLWLTIVVGVLAVLCLVHFMRIRHALGEHRNDQSRRALNAFRERRGF
jgi:cytochrome c biogenesis protein CcdA